MIAYIHQIERLVDAFEAGTLPRRSWTHTAHFVVGLWYVLHYDAETALDRMRRGIRSYNEASGVANTDSSGYHETITVFYLWAIRDFLEKHNGNYVTLFSKLVEDEITRKDYLLRYYSEEVIFSKEARKTWVEPDKQALPDTVFPIQNIKTTP